MDRLRRLVADLEERVRTDAAAASSKYHQMLSDYENTATSQRNLIIELQHRLESGGGEYSTQSINQSIDGGDAQDNTFRDVDLFSSSPPPPPIAVSFSSRSDSVSPSDGRGRSLSHKESLDSGLLEALEQELREKNSTIRHLTQEIARSRGIISDLESATLNASQELCDMAMQTMEDLPAAAELPDVVTVSRSDQSVQSDSLLWDAPSKTTESGIHVGTWCEIRSEVVDEGVQVEVAAVESAVDSAPVESADAYVQTDSDAEEDEEKVHTVNAGVQSELDLHDAPSQTDLPQVRFATREDHLLMSFEWIDWMKSCCMSVRLIDQLIDSFFTAELSGRLAYWSIDWLNE